MLEVPVLFTIIPMRKYWSISIATRLCLRFVSFVLERSLLETTTLYMGMMIWYMIEHHGVGKWNGDHFSGIEHKVDGHLTITNQTSLQPPFVTGCTCCNSIL